MTVTQRRKNTLVAADDKGATTEPGIKYDCDFCHADITHTVRIKCAAQGCEEVDLCPSCFCEGKEGGRHKRWHDYRVVEQHSYPIFTPDWGADEELLLIEGLTLYGLGNWQDAADHVGTRTREECEAHYIQVWVPQVIGGENFASTLEDQEGMLKVEGGIDGFQQRKKRRIEEMRGKALVIPNPALKKPLVSAPTNHEIAGFMPGRLDFEHELVHDEAENPVKELEFGLVLDYGGDEQPDEDGNIVPKSGDAPQPTAAKREQIDVAGGTATPGPSGGAMEVDDDDHHDEHDEDADGEGEDEDIEDTKTSTAGGGETSGKGLNKVKLEESNASLPISSLPNLESSPTPSAAASHSPSHTKNKRNPPSSKQSVASAIPQSQLNSILAQDSLSASPAGTTATSPSSAFELSPSPAPQSQQPTVKEDEDGNVVPIPPAPPAPAPVVNTDSPDYLENPDDLALKLALLRSYMDKLDRRAEAKAIIFDRGLMEYKKVQAAERKRPPREKDLIHKYKVFAKLQTAADFELFVTGLIYEQTLRQRILQLQNYRAKGITTLVDADRYDTMLEARNNGTAGLLDMGAKSRVGGSSGGSAARVGGPDGKRVGDEHGRHSRDTSAGPMAGRRTPAPLNLASAQSIHLLSPAEVALCSSIRILPQPYLDIKQVLIREYARSHGKLKRRDARSLVKIDVNKTSKIWDLLAEMGLLRADGKPPPPSDNKAFQPPPLSSQLLPTTFVEGDDQDTAMIDVEIETPLLPTEISAVDPVSLDQQLQQAVFDEPVVPAPTTQSLPESQDAVL